MSTEWFYEPLPVSGFTIKQKDPDGLRSNPICAVYLEEHARMICAAPEMLEALGVLCNFKRECPCEMSNEELAAWDKARAAVAKAEGGQP
jgi:hypothetical protein